MKYIPSIIILLGIAIFLTILLGCSTTTKQPEFRQGLPDGIHELLHIGNNYASKSITIKDYFPSPSPQGLPKEDA